MTRCRVLDAEHRRSDFRLHIGLFKTEIGIDHLTVDEPQILAVAERLRTNDLTVDQGQAVGIPL